MRQFLLAVFLLVGLAWGGCVQTVKPVAPAVPAKAPLTAAIAEHNAQTIDLLTDPCATQLQDIGGALALFYHDHGGMPASLALLVPLAKQRLGTSLVLVCPLSHEPYLYVPTGLGSPGQSRRLVVYDAKPVHDGWRWGVVIAPPPQGMTTVTPEVIRLSEQVLKVYLESATKGE